MLYTKILYILKRLFSLVRVYLFTFYYYFFIIIIFNFFCTFYQNVEFHFLALQNNNNKKIITTAATMFVCAPVLPVATCQAKHFACIHITHIVIRLIHIQCVLYPYPKRLMMRNNNTLSLYRSPFHLHCHSLFILFSYYHDWSVKNTWKIIFNSI